MNRKRERDSDNEADYLRKVEEQLEAGISQDDLGNRREARLRRIAALQDARGMGTVSDVPASSVATTEMVASQAPALFDMFSDSPSIAPVALNAARTDSEDWDDAEGYYRYRNGDVLAARYVVYGSFGQGVFSTVMRARDTASGDAEVAIKVLRANDVMKKAGEKEREFFRKLQQIDSVESHTRGIVKLLGDFEFRGHLCLVFEPLHMNLRQLLGIYGRNIGISIHAVRQYAKQLFAALRVMKRCSIIHADIKPDNILINEEKTQVRICDLGSAMFLNEAQPTPYLVSRFYRAPEIILGCKYDTTVDTWSVGCTLFELYTGKIMFQGRTNHDMLRMFMTIKGRLPRKLLRLAHPDIRAKYFNENLDFIRSDDPGRKVEVPEHPTTTMMELLGGTDGLSKPERLKVEQLAELLARIFALDPAKRISTDEALKHPFCQ